MGYRLISAAEGRQSELLQIWDRSEVLSLESNKGAPFSISYRTQPTDQISPALHTSDVFTLIVSTEIHDSGGEYLDSGAVLVEAVEDTEQANENPPNLILQDSSIKIEVDRMSRWTISPL